MKYYDYISPSTYGFSMVSLHGKIGYINEKYEEVVECKYDWGDLFRNGFATVMLNNRWYFLNINMKISDFGYNDCTDFSDGFAQVKFNGKWGFINEKYEEVVKCKYIFEDSLSQLKKYKLNQNRIQKLKTIV